MTLGQAPLSIKTVLDLYYYKMDSCSKKKGYQGGGTPLYKLYNNVLP